MKNLIVIIILVALAAAAYMYGWPMIQEMTSGQSVEDRVSGWLTAQKGGDEQTALCMWAEGKPVLPMEVMGAHTDRYDNFRRHHGFYDGINSWEIVSVEDRTVTVRINGDTLRLRVNPGEPIQAL